MAADRVESADERALRRELQALAKKRETLNSFKRQGSGAATRSTVGRESVFARLGGEPTRKGRQVVQLKENNTRGNALWRLGKRDYEDARHGNAVKRQKLHSAVARPEGGYSSQRGVEANRSDATVTSPTDDSAHALERKQRAVAPYAQKDGIARSRRMFGALMGHLGKAKRQIEKDTDLFKRQDTKQHEVEQREKAQSKNLEDQARQEAKKARLETLIVRTELDRSEQIARAKLEHLQMIRKSKSQSRFLVTIASPPIYYLPSRHTKETRELVAASMEAHEAKMKARERSHEEKLRTMESEFETKLEQLREDLRALKEVEVENEEEKIAGEQATSVKEDDTMDDGDQEMNHYARENDERRQEYEDELYNGPPAMEVVNKDVASDSVSGSEPDDSNATASRNTGEEVRTESVKSESQCTDGKERSASPQGTANGKDVGHSDTETSFPRRVKENVELRQEDLMQNDQSATTSVKEACEKAERASHSDIAPTAATGDESGEPVEPNEDAAIDVDTMKVVELRAELKERGLDTKGLKANLVQRLKQAMHDEDETE